MKARSLLLSAASAVAISSRYVAVGAVVVGLLAATSAQAASFSSVRVSGNVRVEASTISDYLGIKPRVHYLARIMNPNKAMPTWSQPLEEGAKA